MAAPSEFRKLFSARKPIDSVAYWQAAQPMIVEEVANLVNGRANQLVPVAEYLAKNATEHYQAFRIHHLLHEAYGFVGRYADAWNVAKNQPNSATGHFYAYRKVLPNLDFPLRSLAPHVPRNSRHWKAEDAVDVYEVLRNLLGEFEQTSGTSLIEHYARVQDRVLSGVEKTTGVLFERYKSYMPNRCSVEELKELRVTVPRLGAALQQQLHDASNELAEAFGNLREVKRQIDSTVANQSSEWLRGNFWHRLEFLYGHVYSHWVTLPSGRWDIREFYAAGHSIRVPFLLGVIRSAVGQRLDAMWREAENILRAKKGMAMIGEGWISESKLVAQLRDAFPSCKIDTQATPAWLGRMRFDAYFPEFNIAVEYQGQQHSDAVTLFGGHAGLVTTQTRDQLKRQLCADNGCKLVDVFPDYLLREVVEKIQSLMTSTTPIDAPKELPRSCQSAAALKRPKKITETALGAHDINGCARHGTGDLIRSLVASGADFERLQKGKSESLIYVAASAGNLDTLRAFLGVGLKVDAENCSRGATALARLCNGWEDPSLDAVRILLDGGADVTKSAKGYGIFDHCAYAPPMIGAAISSNLPLAQLLFEYGAKTTIRHEESGYTTFVAGCGQDHRKLPPSAKRLEMLKWLVANGANPRARNGRNQSAFDVAVSIFNEKRADFDLYRYLMDLKVPLNLGNASQLRREFELAPTAELEQIIRYAKTPLRGKSKVSAES
jgi:ankyrin repeat protein